jgi:hypothetical protein
LPHCALRIATAGGDQLAQSLAALGKLAEASAGTRLLQMLEVGGQLRLGFAVATLWFGMGPGLQRLVERRLQGHVVLAYVCDLAHRNLQPCPLVLHLRSAVEADKPQRAGGSHTSDAADLELVGLHRAVEEGSGGHAQKHEAERVTAHAADQAGEARGCRGQQHVPHVASGQVGEALAAACAASGAVV